MPWEKATDGISNGEARNSQFCLRNYPLRQKPLDHRGDFALKLRVKFSAGGGCETGVHTADATVAADEDRRGPGVQVYRLRQLRGEFGGLARDQHWILDSVLADESAQPRRILELIRFFERQPDDLETLGVVAA